MYVDFSFTDTCLVDLLIIILYFIERNYKFETIDNP